MNNNEIETLINTIVNAEVVEVSYNKYTRNAEIKVRIENSDVELKDVIFSQSTYSTNTTKAEKYADLFASEYTDTRRICKHISETVDFDKYNYCVEIEIKKSAKGTIYFVVRDYKRVEVAAEEAEAEAEAKTVEVAEAEVAAEVKLADKPAVEAIKEYYALSNDERKEIIMAIAEQLDEKYEPQKTVKADNSTVNGLWDKRDSLDVTYSLYALVDDTWDVIAMDYECHDVEIPEDKTFAEYVEERFDSRISLISDTEYVEDRFGRRIRYVDEGDGCFSIIDEPRENDYQEAEFTRAIYNVASYKGFDSTGMLVRKEDGLYIEFVRHVVIGTREYAVGAYFRTEEDVVANQDDFGNLNWDDPDFIKIRED